MIDNYFSNLEINSHFKFTLLVLIAVAADLFCVLSYVSRKKPSSLMAVRNVVQLQQPKNSFCQHVLNLHQGPRQPVSLGEQQWHWGAALRARTAGTASVQPNL